MRFEQSEQSGLSSEHRPILTSSYLRSASSAMCFASFSCISWISIFSSSFIARFSITFIPLIGHQRVRISHSRGVSKIPPCNLETQIQPDLSLSSAAFSASSSFCSATASRSWARSSSSSTSWILRFRAATSPSAWDTKKTKKQQEMSWVICHPNYPKWSLTLFPPESRKWRHNDKRTVARKGWAAGG